MAYYSEDLIEEVISQNDIVDVISEYVALKKVAETLWDYARFIEKRHLLLVYLWISRYLSALDAQRVEMSYLL